MNTLTRGALFGAACALCAIIAAGSTAAQTYPPGTNCQSLLPGLRATCMNQVRQMNSGMNSNSTIVPNSAGSATVPAPGSVNSGTTVTPNGAVNPNAVAPNSVAPNGAVNPSGNTNTIIPPLNSGTGATGAPGTTGTGVGAGGAGTGGTSGGSSPGGGASGN